ncbi:MAG: DUF1461 domain-containing protein [Chloroflexota bacterium]
MTLVGAPSAPLPAVATPRSLAAAVLVPLATIVVVLALAILPLLTPLAMHPLLAQAQAAAWLGTSDAVAAQLSDATVHDLVLGGEYAITLADGQPLYGADEVGHLRDARTLLWLLLAGGAVSGAALAVRLARGTDRPGTWRGIARGGVIAVVGTIVIGVVGFFAFEPLFELFHRVFFPGGNWAFDPATSRLVRLYPYAFWELAATALGLATIVLGSLAWLVGRTLARRSVRPDAVTA